MYKLMVVAGPNRGSTFAIRDGENWIGRQPGCSVTLVSSRISKRHCVVNVQDDGITVTDPGSANGTFVNGALTRSRKLKVGDRISVGEFVLQLMEPAQRRSAPDAVVIDHPSRRRGGQEGDQFPMHRSSRSGQALALNPYATADAQAGFSAQAAAAVGPAPDNGPVVPTDLKGKAIYYFDLYVMPFFFGMNLKNEWRVICAWAVGGFVLLNLMISVQPLLESSRQTMVKEIVKRARYMARQIADNNSQHLAARAETKTEIGAASNAEGVRDAVLTDLSNRIIAPAIKQNSYLANGAVALYAVKAAQLFKKGQERGVAWEIDDETVAAYEPVKVLNPTKGRNEIVAMAVVSIDTTLATESLGEMGMVYSETLILTGILAGLLLLVLYKLTLKPFQVLADDMDRVLKGDMSQVTQEFKFEEMNALWDLVNSTLNRVPKRSADMLGGAALEVDQGITVDEAVAPVRELAESAGYGVAVCGKDRKVSYINANFEEVTGIRADGAVGEDLTGLARDQAFAALISDLFDRAASTGGAVNEDFEFGGVAYRVQGVAVGSDPTSPKAFVLILVKGAES